MHIAHSFLCKLKFQISIKKTLKCRKESPHKKLLHFCHECVRMYERDTCLRLRRAERVVCVVALPCMPPLKSLEHGCASVRLNLDEKFYGRHTRVHTLELYFVDFSLQTAIDM